jgi:hypothetical protein
MGKRKNWTEKDKMDLVHYLKLNMNWRAISEKFDCTPWQVQRFAHSLGLNNKGPFLPGSIQITFQADEVLEKNLIQRAKEQGISKSQLIRNILREAFQKRRHSRKDTEEGES